MLNFKLFVCFFAYKARSTKINISYLAPGLADT